MARDPALLAARDDVLTWNTIASRQWSRVLVGGAEVGLAEAEFDSYLFVIAARNVLRGVERVRSLLKRDPTGSGSPRRAVNAAIDGFRDWVPNSIAVRDMLEHFDDYRKKGTLPARLGIGQLDRPDGRYVLTTGDLTIELDSLSAAISSIASSVIAAVDGSFRTSRREPGR